MDHFPSFFFFLNLNKKKSPKQNKHTQQKVEKPTRSSIDVPVVKTDDKNKRAVFLNLHCFYQHWRSIRSEVIHDAIIILPNVYTEWISNPMKNTAEGTIGHILSDDVFLKLLQWKLEQCLLFCMLNSNWNSNDNNSKIHPFWYHLNRSLCELSAHYKPLMLDRAHYVGFESKYGVTAKQIVYEIETLGTRSYNVAAEILFQSNPSLNIITSYFELTRNMLNNEMKCDISAPEIQLNKEPSQSIGSALIDTPNEEMDELLDNILEMYPVSTMEQKDVIAPTDTAVAEEGWWFADDYEL